MRISRFGERVKSDQSTQTSYGTKACTVNEQESLLDLFSTTATCTHETVVLPHDFASETCINHAPLFAFQKQGKSYGISQGCCNSWTCPRCGQIRARHEYGRVVEGIRTLSQTDNIWFITITCRGKEITRKEADDGYGQWTHKLLDAWRLQSKRTHQKWAYVQVTERQKRGHPHSHILTTFCPKDLSSHDWKWQHVSGEGYKQMAYVQAFRSDYLQSAVIRSGLGQEYDITPAGNIEAVSRYVAKYLFKDNIFNTVWPKGWKRIRYSQSFPKLERTKTASFVLIKREDWQKLAKLAVVVSTKDLYSLEEASFWLRESDTIVLAK